MKCLLKILHLKHPILVAIKKKLLWKVYIRN